jgi:long-chain acyl-CoA synthetase
VRGAQAWEATTWAELLSQAQRAARGLVALGVQPGEAVCILGFNRPEWLIMDHAAMMVGAATAGIYWTSAPPEVEYIIRHSRCAVLLLEDAGQLNKVAPVRGQIPTLKTVIAMRGAQLLGAMRWKEFMTLGDDAGLQTEVDRRLRLLRVTDPGSLIYTSGTTGPPKAVILSHDNLAWTAEAVAKAFGFAQDDRLISYLPLAHVAERLGAIHLPARIGYAIYFARSIEALLEHMKEVRPTVYFGVPRVWEKLRSGLSQKLSATSGIKGKLANRATRIARRWHEAVFESRRPGFLLDLQMKLARRLVLSKIHRALGLDQARFLISSAAPISIDNLRFFLGLDMIVREVYGQTEASGPTTVSLPGSTRIGSVGQPLPGIELRIAEDGEVLVKGLSVFQGYAGQPDATAEALQGGWLHTGDLGRIDADGYLYIIGRKKDLIITSGGENISAANLEADLMSVPLIEHAVVVGDGRHFLSALVTLEPDAAQAFALRHGLRRDGLERNPRLLATLQAEIDNINTRHARVANIRKFAVIAGGFSIARGELTATLKLRRRAVIEAHQEVVNSLYRD